MVGVFSHEISDYDEAEFQLLSGDRLFLYTDGIMELADENEKIFGIGRLADYLLAQTAVTYTGL